MKQRIIGPQKLSIVAFLLKIAVVIPIADSIDFRSNIGAERGLTKSRNAQGTMYFVRKK